MKQQAQRKVIFRYIAITLVLAVIVVTATALTRLDVFANAEPVKLTEGATVAQSPFTQAVQKVKDSVVGVNQYGTVSRSRMPFFGFGDPFGYAYPDESDGDSREVLRGSGSGVVIAQGYVLTNYHVVDRATSVEVEAGDKTFEATIVGSDENLDVAVLKVDGLALPPVTLGDSDLLNVGDWAICIGNPLSFTGTTTVGIISALNREIQNTSRDIYGRRTKSTNMMIQTDAAINSGNSGGGMFNVAGELVGIPSLKYGGSTFYGASVEGIGMAIPINAVKPLLADVVSGKTTDGADAGSDSAQSVVPENKPRIGVSVTDMDAGSNPAVAMGILPNGAYVADVESGSPAENAGLKPGDIVVEVDGTVITSTRQMVSILQAKSAGDIAAVKIYRVDGLENARSYEDIPEGEYIDLKIELAILDNVKQ
ncbi:MAG: trypsin-like peptidase domain-containing protein [Clostridia bacterium]|nr:trypsin-like peptidase domain-containing protein [Clostridia bacterium]